MGDGRSEAAAWWRCGIADKCCSLFSTDKRIVLAVTDARFARAMMG